MASPWFCACEADKAKPGLKGNLILDAFREVAPNAARREPGPPAPAAGNAAGDSV